MTGHHAEKGDGRTKLADVIKKRLSEKGLSQDAAAKHLGVPSSTVRNWLNRNTFPEDELLKLMAFLGLKKATLSSLEKEFLFHEAQAKTTDRRKRQSLDQPGGNTQPSLDRALGYMDERFDQLARGESEFAQDVRILFRAMKKGDVFVYWSVDQLPYEMRGSEEAAAIVANAINSDAMFAYLYPAQVVVDEMRRAGQIQLLDEDEYDVAFESYKLVLLQKGGKEKQISENVIRLRCHFPAFAIPGHKYVLFRSGSSKDRALAGIPTGTKNRPSFLHVPMSNEFTDQFRTFIRRCAGAVDKDQESVAKQLLSRL